MQDNLHKICNEFADATHFEILFPNILRIKWFTQKFTSFKICNFEMDTISLIFFIMSDAVSLFSFYSNGTIQHSDN